MRNASFQHTQDQILDRSKTKTRRLNWHWAKPGMLLQPIVKGQGLKPGEKVETLGGPIRIVAVRREPLADITPEDCAAEGFPELSPLGFVTMFCKHMGCKPVVEVTVVTFEYLN